jgi:putative membrane protein
MVAAVFENAVKNVPENIAAAWSLPLAPVLSLVITCAIYLRGFLRARRTRAHELPPWRATCFLLGIASLWIAIASPIAALDDLLLTAHMTQHLILMSVAPPLLLLGAPVVPLLRGLPRFFVQALVGPLLRSNWFQHALHTVKHPVFGWLSMNIAYVAWHVPSAFELALRSEAWHNVEHLCFFSTSLAFWWTVIQPWPGKTVWSRWAVVPYLITADIVNTGLSAFLAFCGRVIYPTYEQAPRVFRLSALNDQVAAGAEMWVLGSSIFLLAAVGVMLRLLRGGQRVAPSGPGFIHAASDATCR